MTLNGGGRAVNGKEMRMDLTWVNVLKVAATTGVLTTLLNQGVGLLREWWINKNRKKSEATYLAMRLAVILEEFAVKCAYTMQHGEADYKEGAVEFSYNLPTLAPYPQESDWKSLDHKLAAQIMSFPNEISAAEMSCEFQRRHEGYLFGSSDETIVAGAKACRLAQSLRKKYSLDINPIADMPFLESKNKKIQERHTRRTVVQVS